MVSIGFTTFDFSHSVPDESGNPTIGGAGWYRMALPMRWLAEHGHETRLGTLAYDKKLDAFVVLDWEGGTFACDIMVMQRWMHDGVAEYITSARMSGQVIVNDLDDWFFGIDKKHSAYHSTDARVNKIVNREHYAEVLKRSDLITVSTPYLATQCRKMFPKVRVEVLRNAIDLARWKAKPVTDAEPVVGWVGALPFRSGDLGTEGARAVGAFCNEHGLSFHHSGWVPPPGGFLRAAAQGKLTNEQRRYGREWYLTAGSRLGIERETSDQIAAIWQYPSLFDPIDIGIVPLADVPFNQAKSAIKGMEYAASGIPFVAQSLPEQAHLRTEYGIGRTARSRSDWAKELRRMLDISWRAEQREANLAGVKALDIESRGADWQALYQSILH